jgi:hypothetical protein
MTSLSNQDQQKPSGGFTTAASTNNLSNRLNSSDRITVLSAANNGGRPNNLNLRPPTSGEQRGPATINFYNQVRNEDQKMR